MSCHDSAPYLEHIDCSKWGTNFQISETERRHCIECEVCAHAYAEYWIYSKLRTIIERCPCSYGSEEKLFYVNEEDFIDLPGVREHVTACAACAETLKTIRQFREALQ